MPVVPLPCMLCDSVPVLVTGKEIYPGRDDLAKRRYWKCPTCPDSYVGCHPRSSRPLGTPAPVSVRGYRNKAHTAMDPIWRKGKCPRGYAYQYLAAKMELPLEDTHIGLFDKEQCKQVIAIFFDVTPADVKAWVRAQGDPDG